MEAPGPARQATRPATCRGVNMAVRFSFTPSPAKPLDQRKRGFATVFVIGILTTYAIACRLVDFGVLCRRISAKIVRDKTSNEIV